MNISMYPILFVAIPFWIMLGLAHHAANEAAPVAG